MAKEKPKLPFNNEAHEEYLSMRYAQLGRYQAFDDMIDMALDGFIAMDEALKAYIEMEKASKLTA